MLTLLLKIPWPPFVFPHGIARYAVSLSTFMPNDLRQRPVLQHAGENTSVIDQSKPRQLSTKGICVQDVDRIGTVSLHYDLINV
jgi:hypothetical protein